MIIDKKEYVCSLDYGMEIIKGKWKSVIICQLNKSPIRFLELQRQFPNQMKDPIKEFSTNPAMPSPPQMPNQSGSLPQPRKKTIKVKFESKTQHPFEAEFTERGFKIGNTRLSFETIEDAISKNITLTLDGGSGLVLDAVRMQKILKYKGRT